MDPLGLATGFNEIVEVFFEVEDATARLERIWPGAVHCPGGQRLVCDAQIAGGVPARHATVG